MTLLQSLLGGRSFILVPLMTYVLTGLMRCRALWLTVISWWIGIVKRLEVSQNVAMRSLPAGAALEQGYRRPCITLVMCLNNELSL